MAKTNHADLASLPVTLLALLLWATYYLLYFTIAAATSLLLFAWGWVEARIARHTGR